MERTEIIIGANSKVAREYMDYLELKNIPTIAVYRTGDDSQFAGYSNVIGAIRHDVRANDWSNLEKALTQTSHPRIVYLAAETKLSPDASFNDHLAINALPVERIVNIIGNKNIPLVYVSSDMVFGGKIEGYSEDSIPLEPYQKYGITKRIGELYALKSARGTNLRCGNITGTERDFPSSVIKTLYDGGNPKVWTNVYNRFTGINEVCIVLDKLADYPGKQKVFHVASSDAPMSRCELIERIIPLLEARGRIPEGSSKKLDKVKHDFKDNRPETLALKTEITSRELGYKPVPIMCSILEKMDEPRSNYLVFN